jgi:hypothetical protein
MNPTTNTSGGIPLVNHIFRKFPFDDKTLERMSRYCEFSNDPETNRPIDEKRMKQFVTEGSFVAEGIVSGNSDPSPENAKYLMWFLMAKAAFYQQEFISGAFRIDDPHNKVYEFLKDCGTNEVPVYPRISTHFKDLLREDQEQYGIDVRGLPGSKGSILFSELNDGTTYIKMEFHGFPPLFSKNIHSNYLSAILSNTKEILGHTIDFLISRVYKASTGNYEKRGEEVPKNIKKEFEDTMYSVNNLSKKTFFQKLFTKNTEIENQVEEAIRQGKKDGKSKMIELLNSGNGNLKSKLEEEKKGLETHGYHKSFRGNEVCLGLQD